MRKLHLNPDELQVESFRTVENPGPKPGTVHAHEASERLCTLITSCPVDSVCSDVSVCYCDGTYTQRPPYCDPSANTYCVGIEGVCDQTLLCA